MWKNCGGGRIASILKASGMTFIVLDRLVSHLATQLSDFILFSESDIGFLWLLGTQEIRKQEGDERGKEDTD